MLYLVMRFVDGLDLREILKREGPLSPSAPSTSSPRSPAPSTPPTRAASSTAT